MVHVNASNNLILRNMRLANIDVCYSLYAKYCQLLVWTCHLWLVLWALWLSWTSLGEHPIASYSIWIIDAS